MGSKLEERLKGRRFGARMRQALRLVAVGNCPVRLAAETAGLRSWQDVARYAKELGIGRRRVTLATFFPDARERAEVSAMTDGVTDADFEAALAASRSEGNLSRANVVRNLRKLRRDSAA